MPHSRKFGHGRHGSPVRSSVNEINIPVSITHRPQGNQKLQPEPPGPGKPPFRLSLEEIIPGSTAAIKAASHMVLHIAGDTGGVKHPVPQQIVAEHMVTDLEVGSVKPLFFYHLGDVVYYYGEKENYYPQFYSPYQQYVAPIFAIPGNHDGDVDANNPTPANSLQSFLDNFCAPAPKITPQAGDVSRDAMTQPNPYWTLLTPLATFVGLYTNVPEGGNVSAAQKQWFINELKEAPSDRALIVALHHPVYSADTYHTGSATMGQLLDDAMTAADRIPDIIFAAHVHNYQRYTRSYKGRSIPYVVAGSGGYYNLHTMVANLTGIQPPVKITGSDVVLENFIADRHGFMRLEITTTAIHAAYYTVPRPQEPWSSPSKLFESFSIDLTHPTRLLRHAATR